MNTRKEEKTSVRRRQVKVGLDAQCIERFIVILSNPITNEQEKKRECLALFDNLLSSHEKFFATLIEDAAKNGGDNAKKLMRHDILEGYEILFVLCLRFNMPMVYEEFLKRIIPLPAISGARFNYNDALSSIANPIRYLRAILAAFLNNSTPIFDLLQDGVQGTERSSVNRSTSVRISTDHAAYARAFLRKLEEKLKGDDPGIKKIRGMQVRPGEYAIPSLQQGSQGSLQEATITTSILMTAEEMAIVQKGVVDLFFPGRPFAEGVKLFLVMIGSRKLV